MRLAATVMLVRDGPGGVEVLLVRRSGRSAFAPDAFVFPGGTVDPADYQPPLERWQTRVETEFRGTVPTQLPTSEPPLDRADALAVVAAAVRELQEEVAVAIEPDALVYFSHWITPPTEPRRYNTHFFIAAASSDVHGIADAVETHDAQWIAAKEALARHARGAMHLVYPTIKHLERLATFSDVAALLAFARSKPVLTIMPDRAPGEGFVMPPELENAW